MADVDGVGHAPHRHAGDASLHAPPPSQLPQPFLPRNRRQGGRRRRLPQTARRQSAGHPGVRPLVTPGGDDLRWEHPCDWSSYFVVGDEYFIIYFGNTANSSQTIHPPDRYPGMKALVTPICSVARRTF